MYWKTRLNKNDMYVDIHISSLDDTDYADYADWFWTLIRTTVSNKDIEKVPLGYVQVNGTEIEKGSGMKELINTLIKY